ncbi:MAG: biotin-independent malonate decarboxylase subunit gamma [Lachnospiraceae bacterium]
MESYVGRGRDAMEQILDDGSFMENVIGGESAHEDIAPGAVVGTGAIYGRTVTVIGTDAMEWNERFPCVAAGIIGLEEAFKMAAAVYRTIEADEKNDEKTPILLIVDTPGNGPGKVEEIVGMNKATGSYQLALAEARQHGHPVIAMVIGRAISGAFLCHGLQADRILSLPKDMGTMIHVMPLSSIARITKMDIERLVELSESNPVFAAGAEFF